MELPKYAYFQGEIVPYEKAKVGVLTHALNYGTAAFGGLRGYWNDEKEQLYLFRPKDHYQRLLNSAKILRMDFDHTPESLTQITIDLLNMEGYRQDVYVRPLVYKSEEVIGVRLHDLDEALSIVSIPFGLYIKNETNAHLTISSWRRIDDNVIPARGKISGAYANSALIKTDASLNGFDDALVLNQNGHVSEASAMNVFLVRDGVLITPPVTENVLEGIIRRSVIVLAEKELGLPIHERPVDRTELFVCDEVFLTGTAVQITAVTQIDHLPVGNGLMGPVTSQLRELFFKLVRGRNLAYQDWVTPVYG
jgi:branched-chain amino acid aminotransferase